MKSRFALRVLVLLSLVAISAGVYAAAVKSVPAPAVAADRFLAIDVVIDPHTQAMAAYQLEIVAPASVHIVGVEGGAVAAYNAAPYYDPQAITHNRIILAAFSLDKALPTAATRVARLHLHVVGNGAVMLTPTLMAAADAEGRSIPATVALQETP